MGTPKKPSELRRRLGDPSNRKTPTERKQAPEFLSVPAGMTANAPSDLSDEAKALWAIVTSSAGWLVESDTPSLILLCRLHDKVSLALRYDDVGPSGASMIKTYLLMLDKFGLTPSARINLGLAVAETESKLEAFRKEAG